MMRTAIVALMLGAGLTSCASFKKEQSGAELRKEGYEALLKTVKPGMYRRQLYAVLPPYKKPMARPPVIGGRIFMLPSIPGREGYLAHQEKHELDEECWVIVNYQLRDGKEYPPPPQSKSLSLDSLISKPKRTPLVMRSKENPDDIIYSVSAVCLKSSHAETSSLAFSTFLPTQENAILFGRKDASLNEVLWLHGAFPQPTSKDLGDFPFTYPGSSRQPPPLWKPNEDRDMDALKK